jgi:AraC-like DNA-binding protein
VFHSPLAFVEDLQSAGPGLRKTSEGYSPEFQVCLPYRGLFIWHVGGDDVVADANQALFVTADEPFQLTSRPGAGYAELIVTPHIETLAELAGTDERRLRSHVLFRRRSCRMTPSLQALRARALQLSITGVRDALATEDLVLGLLRSALQTSHPVYEPGLTTRRLIARAKEFVEAHLSAPLRLTDVGRAAGASPAYLTDVFRRAEGVPLHQYVMQLRLAHALVELPHSSELTRLALDLGFSSHSHFAAVFRRAFGCTPSQFRSSTRTFQHRRVSRIGTS